MVDKTTLSEEQLVGKIIDGKYKLVEMLGEGGMAVVYRANRLRIGDDVAVKILRSEVMRDLVTQARFEREAQAAARIKHPNIVTIHDFGTSSEGFTYLIMELLTGPTLEMELRNHGQFSIERAVTILASVCKAISAAHREGIIHRDLKPSNILLHRFNDGQELVKVVDFGIVKMRSTRTAESRLTQVNNLLGTPHYMSPEQCLSRELDVRSDVYTIGVIAYELLVGRLPFDRPTVLEIMEAHVKTLPPSLRSFRATIPAALDYAVLRALSKNPEQRPQTAYAFAQELTSAVGMRNLSSITGASQAVATLKAPTSDMLTPVRNTQSSPRLRDTLGVVLPKSPPDFEVFVNRRREMERLGAEYYQLLGGKARPIMMLGDQGIGLSRLGEEFKNWVRQQGSSALMTRFYEPVGGGQSSLHIWLDTARRMLGISRKDIRNETELVEIISKKTGIELADIFNKSGSSIETDKWRIFEVISQMLLRALGDQHGVFIFDNIHFADPLNLELLSYLVRNGRTRFLYLFLLRADIAARKGHYCYNWLTNFSKMGSYESIRLQPFNEQEMRQLLEGVLGSFQMPERALEKFWNVSRGNPYYICEILKLLLNDGRLSLREDAWYYEERGETVLPESLQQLGELKLARLDEDLMELLRQASVIGQEFSFSLLEQLTGLDEDKLGDLLERAVKDIIVEELGKTGEEYRFHDPALYMMLYEGLSRRHRRRLHLQVGEILENIVTANPKKLQRFGSRLVYHYYNGNSHEKVFKFSLPAAEEARSRLALGEAETYYSWGIDSALHLEDDGETPDIEIYTRLQTGFAEVSMLLGKNDRASELLDKAYKLAKKIGNGALLGRLHLAQSRLELSRSDFEQGLRCVEDGLVHAQEAGELALEGQLLMSMARIYNSMGRHEEAVGPLECNLEIARQLEDQATESQSLSLLGRILGFLGNFKQARSFAEEALRLARLTKDRFAEMIALLRLGQIETQITEYDKAFEIFDLGLDMSRSFESSPLEGAFLNSIGDVYRSLGELEMARSCYQKYLAIAQMTGNLSAQAISILNLGTVTLQMGLLVDAKELFEQALSLSERLGDKRLLAEIYYGQAHLQEQTGLFEDAISTYRASIKNSQLSSLPTIEWQASYNLASCLYTLGKKEEGMEHLERASEIVEQMCESLPESVSREDFMADKQKIYVLLEEMKHIE